MIELELTYLAKYLPRDLDRTKFKEIIQRDSRYICS